MKLYKVEITSYPADALDVDPDGDSSWPCPLWQPEGWGEYSAARWGEVRRFWWPSTKRLYQSLSGAKARAALIEHWGATAEIVESDEIVWLTPDVKRARRIAALRRELDHLELDRIDDEELVA